MGLVKLSVLFGLSAIGALSLQCAELFRDTSCGIVKLTQTISSDETWLTSQSPIRLKGAVVIAKGASLTIQPGVEVIISQMDDTSDGEGCGVEDALSSIVVNGRLYANGTRQHPVVIHSDNGAVSWSDLRFDGVDTSALSFCSIQNCASGLHFNNSANVVVNNSQISDLTSMWRICYGVYANASSNIRISNCVFKNTAGVALHNTTAGLYNNIFDQINDWHVILEARCESALTSSIHIENNIFRVNNRDSVFLVLSDSAFNGLKYNCFDATAVYFRYADVNADCCPTVEFPPVVHMGIIDTVNAIGTPSDTFYNVFQSPNFSDDSYHLAQGSICIDAGDQAPSFNDPDGTPNDMGIYGGVTGAK